MPIDIKAGHHEPPQPVQAMPLEAGVAASVLASHAAGAILGVPHGALFRKVADTVIASLREVGYVLVALPDEPQAED